MGNWHEICCGRNPPFWGVSKKLDQAPHLGGAVKMGKLGVLANLAKLRDMRKPVKIGVLAKLALSPPPSGG